MLLRALLSLSLASGGSALVIASVRSACTPSVPYLLCPRANAPLLLAKKKKGRKTRTSGSPASQRTSVSGGQSESPQPDGAMELLVTDTDGTFPSTVTPTPPSGMDGSSAARRAARRAARQRGTTIQQPASSVTGASAFSSDEPQFSDETATDSFLEDNSAALDLPTLDDFRAREAAAPPMRDMGLPEYTAGSLEPRAQPKSSQDLARERLMELLTFDTIDGPTAEMVDREPYDWTARLIGRGLPNKAGVYLLPYLQTGHMLLIGVLLLCSFVSYPGFPLTQVSITCLTDNYASYGPKEHCFGLNDNAYSPCMYVCGPCQEGSHASQLAMHLGFVRSLMHIGPSYSKAWV